MDGINNSMSYTNDLHTTFELFGIEGVRTVIAREFFYLAAMNDIKMDPRHIYMIADLMTFTGILQPLRLPDLRYAEDSFLDLMMFQKHIKALFMAVGKGVNESPSEIFMGAPINEEIQNPKVVDEMIEKLRGIYGVSMKDIYESNLYENQEISDFEEFLANPENPEMLNETTDNPLREIMTNLEDFYRDVDLS